MTQGYTDIVERLVVQYLSKHGYVDAPAVAAAAKEASPGVGLKELIDTVIAQAVRINATVKL